MPDGRETAKSGEYINDFLYFVVREAADRGLDAVVYCSGMNITRFTPITKGQHGLSSNPVIRGLQRINHGVRELALSRGGALKSIRGRDCAGIAPTPETWYTEMLLIEKSHEILPGEIISYSVASFIEKIKGISMVQDFQMPHELPDPGELQVFLESLCNRGS